MIFVKYFVNIFIHKSLNLILDLQNETILTFKDQVDSNSLVQDIIEDIITDVVKLQNNNITKKPIKRAKSDAFSRSGYVKKRRKQSNKTASNSNDTQLSESEVIMILKY